MKARRVERDSTLRDPNGSRRSGIGRNMSSVMDLVVSFSMEDMDFRDEAIPTPVLLIGAMISSIAMEFAGAAGDHDILHGPFSATSIM